MPYWDKLSPSSVNLESVSPLTKIGGGNTTAFYEIEPAIVLDIVLDKDHRYFKTFPYYLNPSQWQRDRKGNPAEPNDLDLTWQGRALVRLLYTQANAEKENLVWALPLDSNISEYPLINEVVGLVFYLGKPFYTRKINLFNLPNTNADFAQEVSAAGFSKPGRVGGLLGNRELFLNNNDSYKEYEGPRSKTSPKGGQSYEGALGRYFYINKNIRSLKRREGDLVIESRFGQSIRFAAYDDNRDNDKGFDGYQDYKGDGTSYKVNGVSHKQGGGNPMIILRNRQRPLSEAPEEKNVGGYMLEDVNNDGSSIHITSGMTPTSFKTNCYKKMWGTGEEQSDFEPAGATSFTYPNPAIGDQIVVNSDRIIISSKKQELFQFAKKRMAFVTDSEYTVDAHDQIVFTTNTKTVFNSPAIYLGEYDQTSEPVLLGQTTISWLYELCNWMLDHTHYYTHKHPDAQGGTTGDAQSDKTQTTLQAEKLKSLRDVLGSLLSRRVFVVGGGYSPGSDGVEI